VTQVLILPHQLEQLLRNGAETAARLLAGREDVGDYPPVVKLFTPDAGCTWLLNEIDPEDRDTAFGLCDLGFGCPEVGSVSISEIISVKGPMGMKVERDIHFKGEAPLSVYADEARRCGQIVSELEKPA
jgi:hypothetical protein